MSKATTESLDETRLSSPLLYSNLAIINAKSWLETNEQHIKDKTLANNSFNTNVNVIKGNTNCNETRTMIYNKNLSRYQTYINIAEATEMALSSIAATAATRSVELTGIEIPYSITANFAFATICGSLSKTVNTKIRNKTIKYSQMYNLSKQLSIKFNKLHIRSIEDNEIDNDEYNDLVSSFL